jgi:hypothetical protein
MFGRLLLIAAMAMVAIGAVGLGVSFPSDHLLHTSLIAATAVAVPESILAALRTIAPEQADDNEPLVGFRAIASFATAEGFRVSLSSVQKYCAPSVNTGPQIIGHWGTLPMTTKGHVRTWIRSRIRPARPTEQPNQKSISA